MPKRKIKPLIKPCAFCYSDQIKPGANSFGNFFYYCDECGSRSGEQKTEKEALSLWNRRGPLHPKAVLVSRTRPVKGTKTCILSTGGKHPFLRVYKKHNPDIEIPSDKEFIDYCLDLDFIFDLWAEIDDTPMEDKTYQQPDGTMINVLGFSEYAMWATRGQEELKPGETTTVDL